MIRSITVRGLGPHDHTEVALSPRGWTEVAGPSEAGKSTLIDALCLALWGEDRTGAPMGAEQIREGSTGCEVELELASGTTLQRRLIVEAGARKHTRVKVSREGIDEKHATEKGWREALGALGRDEDLLRLVMVPMAWQSLAAGEGGGRPLRDAVLRATSRAAVDLRAVVEELLGEPLTASDSTDEARAKAARTTAGQALERARGTLDAVRQGLAAAKARTVEEPAPELVLEAAAAVEAWPAWQEYDRLAAVREQSLRHDAAHARRVETWRKAVESLGAAPPDPREVWLGEDGYPTHDPDECDPRCAAQDVAAGEDRLRAAERAERDAIAALDAANTAMARHLVSVERLVAEVAAQRGAVAVAEAAEGGTCPTCGRDGWADGASRAADHLAGLRATLADADARLQRAKAITADLATEVDVKRTQADLSARETQSARATLREVRQHADELANQVAAHDEWHRRRRDLGDEPTAPGVPPTPTAPETPRPEMPLEDARRILSERDRAVGALEQIARDVARLTQALADSEAGVTAAEARVDRAERLVEAVRRAPTIALERQLGALGDLGPVSLRPQGVGGLAVLIDGRAWQLASDGRQVVADMWLRAGLRRALGLPWLTVWVDRAQDVGGQDLPPIAGPVVLLRTTDGPWTVTTEPALRLASTKDRVTWAAHGVPSRFVREAMGDE